MPGNPDDHDRQLIESYIERLLAIDSQREHALGDEDLRRVAQEIGLSDEDLARIDDVIADHLARGRNFHQRGLLGDAAAELHQALVLRPFDAALTAELAEVHYARYQREREHTARERALAFARRAIELDPEHQPAYELLRRDELERRRARQRKRSLVAALVVVAAIALVILWSTTRESPDSGSAEQSPPATGNQELASPPDTARPLTSESVANSGPEREIPLTLLPGDTPGLTLDVERSRLRDFGASYSYELDATLQLAGAEFVQAQARLELLDPQGQVAKHRNLTIHGRTLPPLWPGEAAPVEQIIFEKTPAPAIASARLALDLVDHTPAAAHYAKGPEVPLEWPGDRPAHIDVVVRERSSEIRSGIDERLHWLIVSYQNRGQRPIAGLHVEVLTFAEDGSLLGQSQGYLVTTTGPSLPAGQTWVHRLITKVGPKDAPANKRFARYQLRVLAAE